MHTAFYKRIAQLGLLLLACASGSSQAALKVLACEPEWQALTEVLAGDLASVRSATNALQDPHQIEARPSLIAAARNADLLVCTGAELEIGWLPILLRQSGNPAIQPGQAGYFEAAQFVDKLEVPHRLDRADGDVHAQGNPHVQMDARNIALIAKQLSLRLAQLDATHAARYQSQYAAFAQKWQAAITGWEKAAAPLRGAPIIVHHPDFSYLNNWLGLRQVAMLEPKPGVEASSQHLAGLLAQQKQQPAKMILLTPYSDPRPANWLANKAQLPALVLPLSVGGTPAAKDLFSWYDEIIKQLLQGLK